MDPLFLAIYLLVTIPLVFYIIKEYNYKIYLDSIDLPYETFQSESITTSDFHIPPNRILLKHPQTLENKVVPLGFSWTTLFFGPLTALDRGDFKWFFLMILYTVFTRVSWLIFPFIYNKLYIKDLIKKGYKPVDRKTIDLLISKGVLIHQEKKYNKTKITQNSQIIKHDNINSSYFYNPFWYENHFLYKDKLDHLLHNFSNRNYIEYGEFVFFLVVFFFFFTEEPLSLFNPYLSKLNFSRVKDFLQNVKKYISENYSFQEIFLMEKEIIGYLLYLIDICINNKKHPDALRIGLLDLFSFELEKIGYLEKISLTKFDFNDFLEARIESYYEFSQNDKKSFTFYVLKNIFLNKPYGSYLSLSDLDLCFNTYSKTFLHLYEVFTNTIYKHDSFSKVYNINKDEFLKFFID